MAEHERILLHRLGVGLTFDTKIECGMRPNDACRMILEVDKHALRWEAFQGLSSYVEDLRGDSNGGTLVHYCYCVERSVWFGPLLFFSVQLRGVL